MISVLQGQLDIFVAAHIIGWYAKALILRDTWLCWIISVMFEVLEYSLQHQLPNFAECWWDHWILDVLLCNWLGIWAGMKTCQYLSMKTYSWRSIKDIPSMPGKMKRTVQQFTPHSWTTFSYWSAATSSVKGYLVLLLVTGLFLEAELNAFYLKYLLWLPPSHWINITRLLLIVAMGAVSLREAYQYFTDQRCKRLGAQAWLTTAIIVIESLICIKFGRHEFPNPAPIAVVRFWKGFISLLVLYPIWQFGIRPRFFKSEKIKSKYN